MNGTSKFSFSGAFLRMGTGIALILALMGLGHTVTAAPSMAAPVASVTPQIMPLPDVQTMGNVVCVDPKSQSGAHVRVYGFNVWAEVTRGYCSTDYSVYNAQAFYVPCGWVAVSQWGYNYRGGNTYNFTQNFQTLRLRMSYVGGFCGA